MSRIRDPLVRRTPRAGFGKACEQGSCIGGTLRLGEKMGGCGTKQVCMGGITRGEQPLPVPSCTFVRSPIRSVATEPRYTEHRIFIPGAALISGRYVRQQSRSDRTTRGTLIVRPGFSQVYTFSLSSAPEAGIRRDDPGLLYAFHPDLDELLESHRLALRAPTSPNDRPTEPGEPQLAPACVHPRECIGTRCRVQSHGCQLDIQPGRRGE